jgi:hypothetical protein
VLPAVSRSYPRPQGRFPRVTHPSATHPLLSASDLHVLGAPPAFVLSQDQTLSLIADHLGFARYPPEPPKRFPMNTKMHQTIIPHAIQQPKTARPGRRRPHIPPIRLLPSAPQPTLSNQQRQPDDHRAAPQRPPPNPNRSGTKQPQETAGNPSSPLSTPPRFVSRVLSPTQPTVNNLFRQIRSQSATTG